MSRSRRLRLDALLLAGLTACGTVPPKSAEPPTALSFRLILNQPLEIPLDAASVRLQFGRVVPRNGVREAEPHCIFEIATVRAIAQRIEPDQFHVSRVQRSTSTIGARPRHGPMKVEFDDGPSYTQMFYRTEFRLHSAKQPQVRALTCQSDQAAPGVAIMRHLTLGEIRSALGSYFTLISPAI